MSEEQMILRLWLGNQLVYTEKVPKGLFHKAFELVLHCHQIAFEHKLTYDSFTMALPEMDETMMKSRR